MANLTGIVSGLDSSKIIEATLAQKRLPINRLEAQKKGVNSKISKVGEIASSLNNLKSQMEKMDEQSEVLSLVGTPSDEEKLGVSASGDASPGAYSLEVSQLATHAKYRTEAFASKDEAMQAGTLKITVDAGHEDFDAEEDVVDVKIETGDTIVDVLNKINASGADVDASFLFDGTSYFLQISNRDSGYSGDDANMALDVTFKEEEGALGSTFTGAELTDEDGDLVKNAEFTLDGLDVEVRSNNVTEVLEGVTLDLLETGSSTFKIEKDKEGTKENIQAFVDSYNEVMNLISKYVNVTENSDRGASLAGDTTIEHLRRSVSDIVLSEVAGATGSFSALSHIGITSSGKGTLSLNASDLEDAIDADIDSVGEIFSLDADEDEEGDAVSGTGGLAALLIEKVDIYTDGLEGVLTAKKKSLGNILRNMDKRIFQLEGRVEAIEQHLMRKFSRMEVTISMLQSQGQSLMGLGG
jgi:flagellar hook-associated protein 2